MVRSPSEATSQDTWSLTFRYSSTPPRSGLPRNSMNWVWGTTCCTCSSVTVQYSPSAVRSSDVPVRTPEGKENSISFTRSPSVTVT